MSIELREKIVLRDYQQTCVDLVLASYAQNKSGTELLVLPCAAGKTVIFSHIIDALNTQYGLQAMVIADRDDLLDQAADKFRMVRPGATVNKIGSGLHQYGGTITVASIATISRPEHLERLQDHYGTGKNLFLITDEADLSAAPSYQKVYEVLYDAFHLMVTATPDRLDGKPILPAGKKPLYEKNIIEMIREKYLTDVKCIAVKTKVDLSQIHKSMGDFQQRELADAVDSPARNKLIVEKYKEHTPSKRAVAFCVTIEHAKHLAEAFNEAGIGAEVVTGDTSLDERKAIYKRFKAGITLVMTNVMVLSRGWDEPLCEVGIGARPTQSRALFIQQLGRILRLAPGKQFATWLEVTDNCFNHKLVPQSLRRALNKHFLQDGETILEMEERQKQENAERQAQVRKLHVDREKDLTVNLLETFQWQEREDGKFVLEVGREKHRIALIPSDDGEMYSVWARLFPGYEAQQWLFDSPLDWAQQFAEREARKILASPEAARWADRNHTKRRDPITEKQKKFLDWKKIPYTDQTTKGEASELIDKWYQQDEAKKMAKEARRQARIGA